MSRLKFSPMKSQSKMLSLLVLVLIALPALSQAQPLTARLVVQRGNGDGVGLVAISPNGKLALTSRGLTTSKDFSVCLWEVEMGREIRRFTNHTDSVRALAFSPNNRFAASAGNDKTVRIWDVETGAEIRRLDHSDWVLAIAFSPDGKYLLAGTNELLDEGGLGFQWEIATGAKIHTFAGHAKGVPAVAWAAKGDLLATAGWDKSIRLWHAGDGTLAGEIKEPATIIAVAFSADGRLIAAAGGTDETVHIAEVETGREVQKIKCQTVPYSLSFSPDGSQLLVANKYPDKKTHLWNIKTGSELRTFSGNTRAALSADGRYALTANDEVGGAASVFETDSGRLVHRLESFASGVNNVDVTADANYLITQLPGECLLWNLKLGTTRLIKQGFQENHGQMFLINGLTFSADSKTFVTGEENDLLTQKGGGIQIWDVASGERKQRITTGGSGPVAISPDNNFIFAGRGLVLGSDTADRATHLYDSQSGKEKKKFGDHTSTVEKLALSKDGRFLLTKASIVNGQINDPARLWDVKSGHELFRLAPVNVQDVRPDALALSPDGTLAATAHFISGNEAVVILWDTATGRETLRLEGHTDQINGITFSPDGSSLATASNDRTVRLWNVKTGAETKRFDGHADEVNSVRFLSGDKFLVSSGSDATVRIWSVATGKELCQLISLVEKNPMVDEPAEWVVVTPDGRFDTNRNLDQIEGLHWVVSDHPLAPFALELFMRDYYEPKLLPRLLRCIETNDCEREFSPLPDITKLNRIRPDVIFKDVSVPDPDRNVTVTVEVGKRALSASECRMARCAAAPFDLRLFRDGQLVGSFPNDSQETLSALSVKGVEYESADAEKRIGLWREATRIAVDGKSGKQTFTFNVRLPKGKNAKDVHFTAYAFNEDRVKSETATWQWGDDVKTKLPRGDSVNQKAYIISVGVNTSQNSDLKLQYAANDAREMQRVFSERLKATNGYDVIAVPLISDQDDKGTAVNNATKKKIAAVFALLAGKKLDPEQQKLIDEVKENAPDVIKLEKATPDDLVLISFSSHGFADNKGNFFLLPSDVGTSSRKEDILPLAISSDELSLWLKDVDAGEMAMIIDACHAAAAIENKEFKPGPMGSRGLGQLAYDKGMKILTATQSGDFALESDRLKQGLLSYALLHSGLTDDKADFEPVADGRITLREWFDYGVIAVPKLYDDVKNGRRDLIFKEVTKRAVKVIDDDAAGSPFAQQPSLFDFKRKTTSATVAQVLGRAN
jgi:WD40 repeat protein